MAFSASKEKYLGEHHTIDDDGYNVGRDFIVERAVAGSRWKAMWWIADVEWEESLLKPGADGTHSREIFVRLRLITLSVTPGINHNITQDGRVAVLTVHRL